MKTLETTKRKYIYNEIPQPFAGIDVIGMGTFGEKKGWSFFEYIQNNQ